jgi:hypothetical protein
MSTHPDVLPNGSHPEFTPQIGSKDKSVGWYYKSFPEVTLDARELLEGYAHILGAEVEKYVLKIV